MSDCPEIEWGGCNGNVGARPDQLWFDLEDTSNPSNDVPSNTLLTDAPTWFGGLASFACQFTGTATPNTTAANTLRMEAPIGGFEFYQSNMSDLWTNITGQTVRMRGIAYAPGETLATTPVRLFANIDGSGSFVSGNNFLDDFTTYSSLSEGDFLDASVELTGVDWSTRTTPAFFWCAKPNEATVSGEKFTAIGPWIERDGAGVIYHNFSKGGTTLADGGHWIRTDIIPASFYTGLLPALAGAEGECILFVTAGIGTDASQFAANLDTIITRFRAGTPNGTVVLGTAYAWSTSTSDQQSHFYDYVRTRSGILLLDTHAFLPAYDEGVALGYYSDLVHYNATGVTAYVAAIGDIVALIAANGDHSGYLGTDLTTDPMQVGVSFELSGVGTVGSSVVVTVNGEAWGSTTCAADGTWSITNTPTAAMRGAGTDVNTVATFGASFVTTRPSTIAAA
jgi:hypothetical protein